MQTKIYKKFKYTIIMCKHTCSLSLKAILNIKCILVFLGPHKLAFCWYWKDSFLQYILPCLWQDIWIVLILVQHTQRLRISHTKFKFLNFFCLIILASSLKWFAFLFAIYFQLLFCYLLEKYTKNHILNFFHSRGVYKAGFCWCGSTMSRNTTNIIHSHRCS